MLLKLLNQFTKRNGIKPERLVRPRLAVAQRCRSRDRVGRPSQVDARHVSLDQIFLRDGISEGQFSQVISTEVESIRRACERFEPGYQPCVLIPPPPLLRALGLKSDAFPSARRRALTFICCGKRHKLSFFPSNRGDADPKTGNVKPGVRPAPPLRSRQRSTASPACTSTPADPY